MSIIKRQGLTIRVYDVHADGTVIERIPRTTLVRPCEVHLSGDVFGGRPVRGADVPSRAAASDVE